MMSLNEPTGKRVAGHQHLKRKDGIFLNEIRNILCLCWRNELQLRQRMFSCKHFNYFTQLTVTNLNSVCFLNNSTFKVNVSVRPKRKCSPTFLKVQIFPKRRFKIFFPLLHNHQLTFPDMTTNKMIYSHGGIWLHFFSSSFISFLQVTSNI